MNLQDKPLLTAGVGKCGAGGAPSPSLAPLALLLGKTPLPPFTAPHPPPYTTFSCPNELGRWKRKDTAVN